MASRFHHDPTASRDDKRARRTHTAAKTNWSTMAQSQPIAEIDALGPLLQAAANGDRQAFARVYQLSSSRMFAIALRMTRRRDLAEEALQDAFVTIWCKSADYRPERGAPLAWMTVIVRSRVIDILRRRPAAEATDVEFTAAHETISTWRPEVTADIGGCISRLPDNHRKAILMAYYYGMSHGELADQLAAPLGTVKSWVRRGLLELRECLDQ